jgi:hypothetical protein
VRQPLEVGCRPDASSSTPPFTSSSWYVALAAKSFPSPLCLPRCLSWPAPQSGIALLCLLTYTSNEGTQIRQPEHFFYLGSFQQMCPMTVAIIWKLLPGPGCDVPGCLAEANALAWRTVPAPPRTR